LSRESYYKTEYNCFWSVNWCLLKFKRELCAQLKFTNSRLIGIEFVPTQLKIASLKKTQRKKWMLSKWLWLI